MKSFFPGNFFSEAIEWDLCKRGWWPPLQNAWPTSQCETFPKYSTLWASQPPELRAARCQKSRHPAGTLGIGAWRSGPTGRPWVCQMPGRPGPWLRRQGKNLANSLAVTRAWSFSLSLFKSPPSFKSNPIKRLLLKEQPWHLGARLCRCCQYFQRWTKRTSLVEFLSKQSEHRLGRSRGKRPLSHGICFVCKWWSHRGRGLLVDGKKCPAKEYPGRGTLGGPKRRLVQPLLLRCASGRMQLARLPRYVDHVTKERGSDSSTISRGGSQACFCRFLQHIVMTTVTHGNVLPESSHVESVIKEMTVRSFWS